MYTATQLDQLAPYYSCGYPHESVSILTIDNICIFPVNVEVTFSGKPVDRSDFCDRVTRYFTLELVGYIASLAAVTFYAFFVVLLVFSSARSPIFVKYRDVV